MLARVARALPPGLRALPAQLQQAAAYADGVNLSDRATLKKFVGVEDLLGRDPDARGTLTRLLQQLAAAVDALPPAADYRRAVEATVAYRLSVLDANESDAAVEEVLDSHLEELILEAREELNLVPILAGARGGGGGGGGAPPGGGAWLRLGATGGAAGARQGRGAAAGASSSCLPGSGPGAGARWRARCGSALSRTAELTPAPAPPPAPGARAEQKPWDVPADYTAPVYDYTGADAVLGGNPVPPK